MSSTVIIGAGIIGVATAYYLSDHQPPSSIHLVEASPELFASASGYAGGFLAKDWAGSAVASLGRLSYDEHSRLAEDNGGRALWGYSRTTSISYTAAASSSGAKSKGRGDDWLRDGTSRAEAAPPVADDLAGKTPSWLRRRPGDMVELIADEGSTAQVDPLELCRWLLQKCRDRGVQLYQPATVLSVRTDLRGELASARVAETTSSTETDIPCTRLIITAGAWSPSVFKSLFPHSDLRLPISSLAGHSLVVKCPRWAAAAAKNEDQGCHAIYTTDPAGFSPELYSRVSGHIYIAGLNSSTIPLPELATAREISGSSIAQLGKIAVNLLGRTGSGGEESGEDDDDLETVREGLCFRPVTPWGTPIISRIADEHLGPGVSTRAGADGGVFIAAGHGPWGISQGLGTGMVLAEMVQGRSLSADVGGLALR